MNITTTFQPNSQTTPLLTSTVARHAEPCLAPLTVEDITGDIERMISRIISPYIDPTSFALNADDLKGECRAKLAQIISGGHLAKCTSRAKAFAFVKVAFLNHVRSLVQKNAFTAKRTGHRAPSAKSMENVRKPCHIMIDDPEMDFQLGTEDVSVQQRELMNELFRRLSPLERITLNGLINNEAEVPNAANVFGLTERQIRRLLPKSVREARANLLLKCRAILADCD